MVLLINGIDIFVFALNYMFPVALIIFIIGSTYKLARFAILRSPTKTRAPPRKKSVKSLVKGLVMTFLEPIILSIKKNPLDFIFGLVLLHMLGTIPMLFLLGQHVAFFQHYFKLYGILWPLALPLSPTTSSVLTFSTTIPTKTIVEFTNVWGPLNIILNGDVLSICVIVAIGFKIADKLMEKKAGVQSIRPWDWLSLFLLLGIVVTGFLAAHHYPSADETTAQTTITYRDIMGLHVLLADILLLSIPFTNMWHITFSYFYGKLHEFWDMRIRKGLE